MVTSSPNTILKEKKGSQNSLVSYSYSEDLSTTSGMGKEIKKKINSKNSMVHKFVLPIKKLQKNMWLFVGLFIIIFIIQIILSGLSANKIKEYASQISRNINIPGAISQTALNVRLLSYNLMLNDYRDYGKHINALKGTLRYLDTINMPSVNKEMGNLEIDGSLRVPVGSYAFDSFEKGKLGESYSKMVSYLKYCINREMIKDNETVDDILYEPHFKYIIVNSERNFDKVFSLCKEVLCNKIMERLNLLSIIALGLGVLLILFTLIVAYITLLPLEKSSSKIMYNSLRTFRYFSKDNFEQIICNYEEKIETLCQAIDIDKEIAESESKRFRKKINQKVYLIGSIIIILIYVVISVLPIITTRTKVTNIISLIQASSDRLTLIGNINLFTYEIMSNDRSIFLPDQPQRILKDYIDRLKKKQAQLKDGSYGGPTFDSYPSLDSVLKENGCHRLPNVQNTPCDSIVYNMDYGFTEEVANLPINELIREYLFYVEDFVRDVSNTDKYVVLPPTSKENIKIIYDQFIDSDFFKLQNGLIDNIIGDIQYIDDELINLSVGMIESFYNNMLVIICVGVVLIIIIVIFVLNRLFVNKIKEMNTLISFLFLVPTSIANKNEKYKRFLETSQTDE
ncbi:hypothetical protein LY90DRAFT_666452 [Neocallimastix californiae]|uniref:Uncharacterized protein n=1 Tax=Neocallimastix californiae TaxID=1754190 RepID=A0A1Y2EQZ1_9FUNG|nr:hypothetical protein LY90DRAFT_666452 [Neocallimastix californiae]|eukprot:ORY74001.1 hypothetical protein LY90DRAFT_666452 [Neocallimastix californiae]